MNHDPTRVRKLLLHKTEIHKLLGKTQQKGLTLIPLRIYFSKRGYAKVELGLAKGKKLYDRRETIKTREAGREVQRAIKESKTRAVLLPHGARTVLAPCPVRAHAVDTDGWKLVVLKWFP